MVAIVAGASFGLGQTSSRTLGGQGVWGNPSAGLLGSNFLVNASTGNVVIQQQDEVLIGAGQDIILSRTYNSLGLANDDNGDNWRESAQRVVSGLTGTVNTAGSTIKRTDWDGSEQVFTYDTTKAAYIFKDPAGAIDKLTFASNQWTWTDGDSRVVELYDNLNGGRIVSSTDADGKVLTFTYTSGKLTRVTDANGEYTALSYTGNNLTQIATYTSANVLLGTRVRYTYDASNRLSTVTVDLSPADNVVADGKVVTYTYTYDGTSKRVASISETGSSSLVAFLYDATTGKVTRVTETAASGDVRVTNFDYSVANRTRVTDALSNITDYVWDASGRITSITYPSAVSGAAWNAAATSQVVTYAWDATSGHIASVTDPQGKVTSYIYDANGNRTRDTDAAGNVIDRTFDATTNALLTETHYLVPDPDGAGAGVASSPVTTRYAYDNKNHLRFVIGPEGNVTEYRYNTTAGSTWQLLNTFRYTANNYDVSALAASAALSEATMSAWVTALTDKSTVERTDMAYDFRGNVSTVTTYSAADSAGVGLTTSPYTVTTYIYDQFGLLLSRQVSGRTGSEVFTYDGLGRMLTSTDFAGNVTQVAINDAARQTVITLANGEQKTTSYNGLGQQLSSTVSGTGATSQVVSYKYDALGRLRATVDALSVKDYVFYDAAGRKTGYMDRRGYLTEYRYDAANRLIATVEYNTVITPAALATLFDASGNPLNVAFSTVRPTANAADLWSWNIYDAADRLIEAIAPNGAVVKFTYDGDDQLVSKTEYINLLSAATLTGFKTTLPTALTLPTTNANDRATRYFYDKAGLKIGTLDADGALTQTKYDKAGRAVETLQYASLTTAGLRATGDWASLLTSVTTAPNSSDRRQAIVYDDQGHIRYTLDANARPTEFIYNNAGDVIRTVSYGGPIAVAASYSLSYVQSQITTLALAANAATRTTRAVYDTAGRKAFDIDAEGGVIAYAYDSLGNVIKQTRYSVKFATAGDQTLSVMQSWVTTNASATNDRVSRAVFDALGRLVYEVDAQGYVTEHQYDVKNRVVKDIRYPATYAVADGVTQSSLATQIGALPAGAITTVYAYDAVGNVTDVTDGIGIVTHYDFDAFGRNTKITNTTSGSIIQYVYDALDRVVQRTSGITSTNTSAQAIVSFAYDGVGNMVSSTDALGSTTLYTYDAAGNQLTVQVPLSGTSTIVYATTTNVYDAFGNVVKTTDPRGFATYFYYNKLNQLQYQVDAEGYANETAYTIGGAILNIRRMATKPTGTGSVTTLPTFTYAAGDAITTFYRDKLDRVTSVWDAENFHEDYVLNAFGDRTSVTNKLGGTTANIYDKRGLLIQETLPVGSTRPDGTVQAANIVNKYEYDANGNRTKMIEAFGLTEQRTTIYAYDKDNRLISKTGDAVVSTDPSNLVGTSITPVETYIYDSNDNLIEVKDAAGARTLSYYDAGNRKIAQLSPVGTLSTWTYDANGNMLSARIFGDVVTLPVTAGGTAPAPVNASNYRETTLTYDRNNRLLTTSVAGVTTGSYVGSTYTTSGAAITTTTVYDAMGNVIQQTDGNGKSIYTYYNKLGQKVAEVDQDLYLTKWTLDDDGNVTKEIRYATKYTGTPVAGGTVPSVAVDAVNDRTTNFTYDKNGRRLTEARLNVQASTVSGNSITTASATATITYTYNGLGLVTSKKEATLDTTTYGYDVMGRQTSVTGASFTDYTGASVTNAQATSYDGLNNATRTVENGTRVTTFTYGAGGRLASSVDPAGNGNGYYYDVMGRVTVTTGYQLKSDGTGLWNAQSIKYDLAGRQVAQKVFSNISNAWTQVGDTTENYYNSYGEVIARGTNSAGNIANAQEFAEYDKAGRVWRTNFNDGVTKAYMYDANGNATLLLQTKGTVDLKGAAFTSASSMLADSGITKTISVFDARNMLINTIQVSSQNAGAAPIHAQQVGGVAGNSTVYFNSSASVGASAIAATGANAYAIGNVASVSAAQSGYTQINTTVSNGVVQTVQVDRVNLPTNGNGNIHVILESDPDTDWDYIGNNLSTEIGVYSASASTIYIGNVAAIAGMGAYFGVNYTRISVYQDAPGGGRILLAQAQATMSYGTQTGGSLNATQWTPATLQFQNENVNTSVIRILGRASGSSGPYQYVGTASQMTRDGGSAIGGWFKFDASGLMGGNWDLKYFAYDAYGNILDVKNATFLAYGSLKIDPNAIQMTSASQSETVSLSNANNNLHMSFYSGFSPTYVDIMTRPAGSGQGFTLQSRVSTVGYYDYKWGFYSGTADFDLSTMNLTGPLGTTSFDVQLVYRDGSLNQLGISTATFTGPTYYQPGYWDSSAPAYGPGQAMLTREGATDYLIVSGLPSSAASVTMHYRTVGSSTWNVVGLYSSGYGQYGFWTADVTGWGGQIEYWIEPKDGSNTLLGGKSYGTFAIGGQPSALTQYSDKTGTQNTVNFSPPSGQTVNFQRFRYNSGGGWSGWINYGAGGTWNYVADALMSDRFATYNYSIEYETYSGGDANSTIVSRATGSMQLGYGTQSISLTNSLNVPAKVVFNPAQTAGTQLKLFWRDQGSTGAYTLVTLTKVNGTYAWDVSAAGLIPGSVGTRNLEFYYDQYDGSGNLLPTLVGSDHVQGSLTISNNGAQGNGYSSSTGEGEIRWILDTAPASSFLIHRRQTHNAFGEIDSETDGRGNVTNFTYNTEGKLTQKIDPLVDITSEAGVTTQARPTTTYYYDKSGRTVGMRDANGNLTTQTLLAGSGYGDSKALVTAEYRPGSTTTYGYDAFGDLRKVTDGLGAVTNNFYDANHNLIEVDHAVRVGGNSNGVQLKDYYAYDALGRRIKHWTSQLGASIVETTDYDAMGRVTSTKSLGGQTTNYSYTWYDKNSISTWGLGAFGGWQTITTTSAGVTQYQNDDVFGHLSWRRDFGSHDYNYWYDLSGHLVAQVNTAGQNINYAYYDNGYIKSVTDNTLRMKSTFEYDNDGNRTLETYNSTDANPIFYQNAVISYDALNRITMFNDDKALITYKYDANSNRRNVKSVYQDGVGGSGQVQDFWYKYDAQNRFVLTMGALSGSTIVTGTTGVTVGYDAAGNRVAATYGYDGHSETYSYTADGYLENTNINGVKRSSRTNDALGRVTQYSEFAADGVTTTLSRTSAFDYDNRVTSDTTVSSGTTSTQTYDYKLWNGTAYAGADQGSITHVRMVQGGITTDTNYYYTWWDEAKQLEIRINASNPSNPNTGSWAPGLSRLEYDANGHIMRLTDTSYAGGPRVVNYTNDAYGQVLVREEKINGVIGPRQLYYYFNGQRIGDVGNNGPSSNLTDYAAQLAATGTGTTKGGYRTGRPVASADFDQNYQPINSGYPGAAASAYTVRSGDTLRSIAQAVWGDGAMWYLIAEANGLSGSSTLIAGQRLIIPNKVTNVHNNAGTFRVYDPGEAIGDTLPTLPNQPAPPPARKKKGCGGFGMILLAVVAVAVAVVTAGAAVAAVTPGLTVGQGITAVLGGAVSIGGSTVAIGAGTFIAAGAIGGAVGSVVSQGIGVATGLQDKFSWKAVGLAAIAGGVGGAVGPGGSFGEKGLFGTMSSKVVGAALRGAVSNVVTQGIGIATGLQKKFDWAGVASAGVGAGAGYLAGAKLGLTGTTGKVVSGVAGGIAASAAESLVTGKDFGDTLTKNLPSIIGNTIGNLAAEGIAKIGGSKIDGGEIVVTAAEPAAPNVAPDDTIVVTAHAVSREDINFFRANNPTSLQFELAEARAKKKPDATQIADLESRYNRSMSIQNQMLRDAVGQVVQVNGSDYTIKGRDVEFATQHDAAVDAIATAFLVQRQVGDSWERGGGIYGSEGHWRYNFTTGTTFSERSAIGRAYRDRGMEEGQPFNPVAGAMGSLRIGAVWHIHPPSSSTRDQRTGAFAMTGDGNVDFSDGDRDAFARIDTDKRPIRFYLGGSDGSLDVMSRSWNLDRRERMRPGDIEITDTGRGYFADKRR